MLEFFFPQLNSCATAIHLIVPFALLRKTCFICLSSQYIFSLSLWVLSHVKISSETMFQRELELNLFKGWTFQNDPLQTDSATLICFYLPSAKQRSQFSNLLARETNSDNIKHSGLLREHSQYKNNQGHICLFCLLVLEQFKSTWVIFTNSLLQLGICMYILFTSHMAFFLKLLMHSSK